VKELKGPLLIAAAACFWGVSGTAAKYLFIRHIDPLILVQTRVSFSCAVLLFFFALFRREYLRIAPRDLFPFALLGILGIAGSNFFYYYAIDRTNVATGILLQYTAPILVVLYARIVQGEALTTVKLGSLVFSVVGCFLAVSGGDVLLIVVNYPGIFAALASAVSFSFLTIYGKASSLRYPTWTVLFYTLFFASVFWLFVNPPWVIARAGYEPLDWLTFFGIAVISILIPYGLYLHGLRSILSTRAVITSTLEPVIAIASAFVFLDEILMPLQIVGAVLVLSAVSLLQVRRESPLAAPSQ